jgi:hypothetical protein
MQEERAASGFSKKKAEAMDYNDGPSNAGRGKIGNEDLVGDRPVAEAKAKAPVLEAPKPESTPKVESSPDVREVSLGSRGHKPS